MHTPPVHNPTVMDYVESSKNLNGAKSLDPMQTNKLPAVKEEGKTGFYSCVQVDGRGKNGYGYGYGGSYCAGIDFVLEVQECSVTLFTDGLEVAISDHCVEWVLARRLEEVGDERQGIRGRVLRGLGGGDGLLHHLRSGKAFYALEVLFHELGSTVVAAVSPRSYGFFIEHAVAEAHDADTTGFEDAEDIGEDLFGLLQVLDADSAEDGVEGIVSTLQLRLLV